MGEKMNLAQEREPRLKTQKHSACVGMGWKAAFSTLLDKLVDTKGELVWYPIDELPFKLISHICRNLSKIP